MPRLLFLLPSRVLWQAPKESSGETSERLALGLAEEIGKRVVPMPLTLVIVHQHTLPHGWILPMWRLHNPRWVVRLVEQAE